MRKLYLDRKRTPRDDLNFEVVRTYDQFVRYIEMNGLPHLISFGHDLAAEHTEDLLSDENWEKSNDEIELNYDSYKEPSGYHAARFLIDYCFENQLKIPQCTVHTGNSVGGKNIIELINGYLKWHEDEPQTCRRVFWKEK